MAKKKKQTEYALTMSFPAEHAFTMFEWRVGKILKDSSGMGFGKRDMTRYYKTHGGAERAILLLKELCNKFKVTDVEFSIYEID